MSDARFYKAEGPFTLAALAGRIGAELAEPERGGQMVHDIADLEQAGQTDIAVFCSASHAGAFAKSHAGVIVTSPKLKGYPHNGSTLLLAADPKLAFAELGRIFHPAGKPGSFLHPKASVADSARIADGVAIGADAVIGPNCSISHALIGDGVNISSNVSIGGEGFGFVPGPKGPMRVFQVGRVIIEDQVEIGGNCAIDRGSLGDTVIGAMSALDNLVQIGHNVKLGRGCILAGQAGVAGSTTLGDFVMVGGATSISDHLTIGTGAKIAGKSGVMRDVAPGETVAGYPAMPVRQWHRQSAALARLAEKKSDTKD